MSDFVKPEHELFRDSLRELVLAAGLTPVGGELRVNPAVDGNQHVVAYFDLSDGRSFGAEINASPGEFAGHALRTLQDCRETLKADAAERGSV